MKIIYQKYVIILSLIGINTILATNALIYLNKWYIFLIFLALSTIIININIILLLLNKLKNILLENNIKKNIEYNTKKIIQLLPCYNESKNEMLNTINSLVSQENKYNNDNILLIIYVS